jgi:hypothetical protein
MFNATRYGGTAPRVAGEDNMANKGMNIQITRLGTMTDGSRDTTVYFKAFVTTFNETYMSDWNSEIVYGRSDAIPLFKNTARKITLGFKVPATTSGEAYENLGKVQKLAQFLYPSYTATDSNEAQVITRSPLVRLKMMNLLRNVEGISDNQDQRPAAMYDNYDMGGEGLLGAITNVSILHNLEADVGVYEKASGAAFKGILPLALEVTLDFEPIHEHPLGWDLRGEFGKGSGDNDSSGPLFPYGVQLVDPAYDPTTRAYGAPEIPGATDIATLRKRSNGDSPDVVGTSPEMLDQLRAGNWPGRGITRAPDPAIADTISETAATDYVSIPPAWGTATVQMGTLSNPYDPTSLEYEQRNETLMDDSARRMRKKK